MHEIKLYPSHVAANAILIQQLVKGIEAAMRQGNVTGEIFGATDDRWVIRRLVGKVFKEGELDEKSNVQNLPIAGSDKPVKFYNLDVIISVGYRVKSPRVCSSASGPPACFSRKN